MQRYCADKTVIIAHLLNNVAVTKRSQLPHITNRVIWEHKVMFLVKTLLLQQIPLLDNPC